MKNILELAKELDIPQEYIIPYGWDKAKIHSDYYEKIKDNKTGKLVLVTAITPTKAGEGKTTTTIGLLDGFRAAGINAIACLREPSLGPCFGVKGGAVGALKSTIVPADDINFHFTGDMHALTSSINLISACVENHIFQGNWLNINPNRIVWPRALDMNDRSLREIVIPGNSKVPEHKSEFVITVASELMSILALALDEMDFRERVGNIIVAYDKNGQPVYLRQLKIVGAVTKLMKDALHPNLVQTLEGNPVLIHAGPFANISCGINSIKATKMAMKLADVTVTEAGFGADLGAEKFLDIACQTGDIAPDAIVVVATVRALKLHGGVKFEDLTTSNSEAVINGLPNLERHVTNMQKFGRPVVVAINRFAEDSPDEIMAIAKWCVDHKLRFAVNTAALDGGIGGISLAVAVAQALDTPDIGEFTPIYNFLKDNLTIKEKILRVCTEIYGASAVKYTENAEEQIKQIEHLGYYKLPVCIAKTQSSFTDDPTVLNAPTDFTITIREVRLNAGAGLIVPLTGDIMTMPGLPKYPRAVNMLNDEDDEEY